MMVGVLGADAVVEEKYFNRAKSAASPIAASRHKRKVSDRVPSAAKKFKPAGRRASPDDAFVIPAASDDTDWYDGSSTTLSFRSVATKEVE